MKSWIALFAAQLILPRLYNDVEPNPLELLMLPEQLKSAIPDDQLTIPHCKELLSRLQTWLQEQFMAQEDVLNWLLHAQSLPICC